MGLSDGKYKDPYDYEENLAKRIKGARREIASGSISGNFDVTSDVLMVDCKRVDNSNYYKLDYRDFDKVIKRAGPTQIPAMTVNFNRNEESIAILREKDFIALINMISDM